MRIFKILSLILIIIIFVIPFFFTFAHCPLCTAGAGIGAIIAKSLGMKSSAIGVWLGAFSVALGWWLGNLARRNRSLLTEQILKFFLVIISFLSIVLPLKLYFYEIGSFSIFWFGDYGSLFNRTYVYDKFLFGSIIGGLIILISPLISKKIIQIRQGKIFPYQGLIITFVLLIIISIFFQIKV